MHDITRVPAKETNRINSYSAKAAAGQTLAWKVKFGKKKSGTPGGARGRMSLVSYCPFCEPKTPADPERENRASVSARTTFAGCKMGHRWRVC